MGISKAIDVEECSATRPLAVGQDRVAKRMVLLINVIFVLLPLEGILRKWLLSQIEQPLIFIRDPFMLWLIFDYYIRFKKKKSILASLWIVAVIVFIFVAAMQLLIEGTPPAALIVGLRNYFFFFPLTFIIPAVFDEDELKRWAKRWLILSIPIGLLVIAQFYSPVGAWINKDITDYGNKGFVVAAGIVRPYGPFTFTLTQNIFASMMFAITIISIFNNKKWKTSITLYAIPYLLVFSMGALSGGRTYFVQVLIIMGFVFLAGLLTLNSKMGTRIIAGGVVGAIAFLFVFLVVFSDSAQYMSERQENAVAAEGSTSGRMLNIVSSVIDVLPETPVLGYGLGVGTNGGAYLATGATGFALAEYEWPRIMMELGPIFGSIVLMFRVGLCVSLAAKSLKLLRRTGDPAALIFCGFCLPIVGFGQATGSNPMVTLTWFAAGLAFAFARPLTMPKMTAPNGRTTAEPGNPSARKSLPGVGRAGTALRTH